MKAMESQPSRVNYQRLYDEHAHYAARRVDNSFEHQNILLEVRDFKVPHLATLLPQNLKIHSLLEIGCGTGELIAQFPLEKSAIRTGCDISPENIITARRRYPAVNFHAGDFRELIPDNFDVIILSDILEHVEDDTAFLRDASLLGKCILVNLPLECNWLNNRRNYGPNDVSGHLRRYTLAEGLALFERASLRLTRWQQVWIHELPVEKKRRILRQKMLGQAYSGNVITQWAKAATDKFATAVPPFGRRLHSSTLFAAAESAS